MDTDTLSGFFPLFVGRSRLSWTGKFCFRKISPDWLSNRKRTAGLLPAGYINPGRT
ncbi:hypothetical protein AArcCO_0776 [Halalkaliarchaeum sp. AArc-CO]|nr:hypothetical protein AArcCO_0776 [Halalkaliarchaeum sp. AArc-CO]